MELIKFPEQNAIYAKDQPQYMPMPAHISDDDSGRLTCCWKLTLRERLRLLVTGMIWHQVLTFRRPLQPQLLLLEKPSMPKREESAK